MKFGGRVDLITEGLTNAGMVAGTVTLILLFIVLPFMLWLMKR